MFMASKVHCTTFSHSYMKQNVEICHFNYVIHEVQKPNRRKYFSLTSKHNKLKMNIRQEALINQSTSNSKTYQRNPS